jgi:hypothetical protein
LSPPPAAPPPRLSIFRVSSPGKRAYSSRRLRESTSLIACVETVAALSERAIVGNDPEGSAHPHRAASAGRRRRTGISSRCPETGRSIRFGVGHRRMGRPKGGEKLVDVSERPRKGVSVTSVTISSRELRNGGGPSRGRRRQVNPAPIEWTLGRNSWWTWRRRRSGVLAAVRRRVFRRDRSTHARKKMGVSRIEMSYDDRANLVRAACFGVDGRPAPTRRGMFCTVHAYDDQGNESEQRVFDADRRPTMHDEGWFRVHTFFLINKDAPLSSCASMSTTCWHPLSRARLERCGVRPVWPDHRRLGVLTQMGRALSIEILFLE